jgi:putative FmdB family regulatory protein
MPIYEYVCSACGHRTDILHGVHDPGPHFCPECGTEGSMRKAIAAPAIHFKGSGWAKRDRRSATSSTKAGSSEGEGGSSAKEGSSSKEGSTEGSSSKKDGGAAASSTSKESSSNGSTAD